MTTSAACLSQPPRPRFDDAAIASACGDFAAAMCARRQACSYMDYDVRAVFGDDATCLARQGLTCINNLHVTDTGTTASQIEGCAQSIPSVSCSDFYDGILPSRCIAPGPEATGAPCSTAGQCASDFCDVPPHATCGTCQPQPLAGATCQTRADCGRDLVCGTPSGATSGTCVARVGDGAACLSGVQPCVAGDTCVGDNPATSTMGTCRPSGAIVGVACDSSRKTMPGCDGNLGLACTGTAGTCQPILLVAAGAACGVMGTNNAKLTYGCAADGECVKPAGMSIGTCVAAAHEGEACSIDATIGPPCLAPALCVVGTGSSAGTCAIPDPAACF